MILNACIKNNKMVDENICRDCEDKNCRHAGEPTTKEKCNLYSYGTSEYWNGEKDDLI